jgi:hypothetical protein
LQFSVRIELGGNPPKEMLEKVNEVLVEIAKDLKLH